MIGCSETAGYGTSEPSPASVRQANFLTLIKYFFLLYEINLFFNQIYLALFFFS